MYRNGKSAYDIAREHEISLMRFYEIIDQAEREKELQKQSGNAKQQRKTQAREMSASGMSRTEIADRINVHVNTVNKYLSEEEYHFLRSEKPKEISKPTRAEEKNLCLIRSSFEKGDTQNSLARKTGLSVVTVNKLFNKYRLADEFGIDEEYIRDALSEASKRGQEKARKERARKKANNKKKVMKLISEGMSVNEVSAKIGMSVATIKRYQKEENNTDNTQ